MKTIAMDRRGLQPLLSQVRLAGRRRLGSTAAILTDASFSQALAAQTAVVDFWSPTCAPCLASKPAFEDLATNPPGNLFMGTVNADEAPDTVKKYNVDALPTQIYFVNGVEVGRAEGSFTKASLLSDISSKLPAPSGPITVETTPSNQGTPSGSSSTNTAPVPATNPAAQPQNPALPAAATTAPTQFPTTTIVIGVIAVAALAVGITLLARPK